MKKRYLLLIAAVVICAGLCLWLLNADFCIGRMENRADGRWSQLHVYMNDEITVDFPVDGEDQTCLFLYETGRGEFSVKITDAEGNVLHSDHTDKTGKVSFQTSSDVKLWIKGQGHGGVFSLLTTDSNVSGSAILRDGVYSGDQFTATYDLLKANGEYMNFYVDNRGQGPVTITVNGQYDRTIPADKSGHISAPINTFIMPQTMTVNCVSASGEDMNIYWRVAQKTKNPT